MKVQFERGRRRVFHAPGAVIVCLLLIWFRLPAFSQQVSFFGYATAEEALAHPVVPVSTVNQMQSQTTTGRFVRVEALVTYAREALFARDASDSVYCRLEKPAVFELGDRVEIVGRVSLNPTSPELVDVQTRLIAHGPAPAPEPVKADDLFERQFDAHLVEIVAPVIGHIGTEEIPVLVLGENDRLVLVRYKAGILPVVTPGTLVRVRGICSMIKDKAGRAISARVILRSLEDMSTIHGPSYWTANRLLFALVCVGVSMTGSGLWGWAMFRKARRQSAELREKIFREAAAEARLGTALESLAEGVVLQDTAGAIVSSNAAAAEILGLTSREIGGRSSTSPEWKTIREDGRPFPSAEHPAMVTLRTGEPQEKVIMGVQRPSGEFRWISINSRPLFEPGTRKVTGVVASFQDITQARRQHELLIDAHQRQKALLSAIPDLMIMQSPDGDYIDVYTNDPAQLVAPASELIGRNVSDYFPKETVDAWLGCVRECNRTGEVQMLNYAVEIAGKLAHFEARIVPCGENFLNIVRNITPRVLADQERAALEIRLQQARKMESLGTFAGGIAHDFNNLIAVILGNANLAREDIPASHPASESVDEILKACRRATDVVKQILSFSRKHGGRREPANIGAIVAEVIDQLRCGAPTNIEWVRSIPDGLSPVSCAPAEIHQMLSNLGANSVQALNGVPGRISFEVSEIADPAASSPALSKLGHGSHLRIRVHDTGPGMDSATAERIFEPFFTTKAPGQGTGLGLAVVHGIVEAHEGVVMLETAPGRGACFDIYLPASLVKSAGPSGATPRSSARGDGQRLLVVDDESAVGMAMLKVLKRAGFDGEWVLSPEAALGILANDAEGFDLVLSDWTMPGMNGVQLAAAIRARNMEVPILLMTGNTTDIREEDLRAAGVKRVLGKPMEPEALVRAVQSALAT